ncbi:MAG: AMP-binding protein [Actinomycetota bacterium]|nr:AMP-binding protein [Actinomycetota bacterium]
MWYLDLVAGVAAAHGERVAVVGSGRRIRFGELHERTGRLGAALRRLGLRPGDRVALLAANEPEYIEAQAACLRSGFTLVPINTRLADPEVSFILADCTPAVLIGGRSQLTRSAALATECGVTHVFGLGEADGVERYEDLLAAAVPDGTADPTDPDLTALILYTSGTTGRPKGAMIDRVAFTARVLVNCAELQLRPTDVHLAALPMFHIAAFLAYAHIVVGGSVAMLPEFSPQQCLAAMSEEHVTTTVLVPTMIAMLLDSPEMASSPPPDLRQIVYGGASITPRLLARAMDGFGCDMLQQYGMTESGASTIVRPADHDPNDEEKLSSAGSEIVSFEVAVVDDDDIPVPPGELGEVVCRAPSLMRGYWNRPDATAEALRGGWMHTGDIGFRDSRGRLHITDRRNDMVITGGENVYPREVEAALLEHPAVGDVAVLGTADPTWGQVVTAVLVEPAPPDAELESWVRHRLAGYKVPRRWVRVGELPRNATGKVLKHELRVMLAD